MGSVTLSITQCEMGSVTLIITECDMGSVTLSITQGEMGSILSRMRGAQFNTDAGGKGVPRGGGCEGRVGENVKGVTAMGGSVGRR